MAKSQDARKRKHASRNGSNGRGNGADVARLNGKTKHKTIDQTPAWQKTLGAVAVIAAVLAAAFLTGVIRIDRNIGDKDLAQDSIKEAQSTVADVKDSKFNKTTIRYTEQESDTGQAVPQNSEDLIHEENYNHETQQSLEDVKSNDDNAEVASSLKYNEVSDIERSRESSGTDIPVNANTTKKKTAKINIPRNIDERAIGKNEQNEQKEENAKVDAADHSSQQKSTDELKIIQEEIDVEESGLKQMQKHEQELDSDENKAKTSHAKESRVTETDSPKGKMVTPKRSPKIEQKSKELKSSDMDQTKSSPTTKSKVEPQPLSMDETMDSLNTETKTKYKEKPPPPPPPPMDETSYIPKTDTKLKVYPPPPPPAMDEASDSTKSKTKSKVNPPPPAMHETKDIPKADVKVKVNPPPPPPAIDDTKEIPKAETKSKVKPPPSLDETRESPKPKTKAKVNPPPPAIDNTKEIPKAETKTKIKPLPSMDETRESPKPKTRAKVNPPPPPPAMDDTKEIPKAETKSKVKPPSMDEARESPKTKINTKVNPLPPAMEEIKASPETKTKSKVNPPPSVTDENSDSPMQKTKVNPPPPAMDETKDIPKPKTMSKVNPQRSAEEQAKLIPESKTQARVNPPPPPMDETRNTPKAKTKSKVNPPPPAMEESKEIPKSKIDQSRDSLIDDAVIKATDSGDGDGEDETADKNDASGTKVKKPTYKKAAIEKLLEEAEQLIQNRKKDQAIYKYEDIIKQFPNSAKTLMAKAKLLDTLAEERQSNDLLDKAIQAYRQTADVPECPLEIHKAALSRMADRLSFFGKAGRSVRVYQELVLAYPDDYDAKKELAVQYLIMGNNGKAKPYFEQMLEVNPTDGFALVHLGFILKSDGNYEEAIPLLRAGIDTGHRGTNEGKFFFHLGDSLMRTDQIDESYKVYDEGVRRGHFRSRYQRSLNNVDSLRAKPFWAVKDAGFTDAAKKLESNWETIRDEALALLGTDGFFLKETEKLSDTGDWKQFTLYSRGSKDQANCRQAPRTCALFDNIPESSRCKRGQVKFSVMHPGTHVWPHCGPTNCRLRSHLGLVIPQPVRLRVGNTTRTWEEGKVFIFDDSFEHEVWQEADSLRLILIADLWHPDLTENEKRRLTPI